MRLTFEPGREECSPVVTLDIETIKLPGAWRWGSGETNSQRWVPIMCGVGRLASDGRVTVEVHSDLNEQRMIRWVEAALLGVKEVWYCSTNGFDEGVLRGTFINARRAPAAAPGEWPVLRAGAPRFRQFRPGVCALARYMLGVEPRPFDYAAIPSMVKRGDLHELREHCKRDVMENLVNLRGYEVAEAPGFIKEYRR